LTTTETQEPEGTTLNVYSYVVKKGKPVGPREIMRGANLSSPSVAYWHLQKLENSGLLQKNEVGEYVVKEKTSISGNIWIGRNLVPRLIC
jgi:predicted transcriptional regulator